MTKIPTDAKRFEPSGQQMHRAADLTPSTYDKKTRSVEAVFSTGAQVRRWWDIEELSMTPDAIDLSRAEAGHVKLLDHHNKYDRKSVIGTASNVRLENGLLIGLLTFADTEEGRAAEGQVARGELSSVSIGYKVDKWERTGVLEERDIWTAMRWELLEVSLVSVPADAKANMRSFPNEPEESETQTSEKDSVMGDKPNETRTDPSAETSAPAAPAAGNETRNEPTAPTAPQQQPVEQPRSAATMGAILDVAERSSLDNQWIRSMEGKTMDEVNASALAAMQARTSMTVNGGHNETTHDNPANLRRSLSNALASRALGQQPDESARDFSGYSIVDVAARVMGENPSFGRDKHDIIERGLTTGDFPLVLEGAANQILLNRYALAKPTFQRIMARRDLPDFRETSMYDFGAFPMLKEIVEDGEIDLGSIGEGKETSKLRTFGRRARISRQALVNDNLGVFSQLGLMASNMVVRFENRTAYDAVKANSGAGIALADGKAVFHEDHYNIAAAGGAIGVDTVAAGRKAMRLQKDIDGQTLDLSARILHVGPELETAADRFLAQVTPTKQADYNPFAGRLELVVANQIEGKSWRLFEDPSVAPVFHYGYLEGRAGPMFMQHRASPADGVELAVVLDFYADATGYQGGYYNPGA